MLPENEAMEKYNNGELTWSEVLASYPKLRALVESVHGLTQQVASKVEKVMGKKRDKGRWKFLGREID